MTEARSKRRIKVLCIVKESDISSITLTIRNISSGHKMTDRSLEYVLGVKKARRDLLLSIDKKASDFCRAANCGATIMMRMGRQSR
jgi:hypothetical protein